MMMQERLRKLSNISHLPTFRKLVDAFNNYDYFADPLIDSMYPQINEDSLCIQVIRTKLGKTYFDWGWDQELRYKPETEHIIDLAEELSGQLKYEFPETVWFKGHIVCLLPNGKQSLHIDNPYWQKHAHRIVVPIITNPDAVTQVEDEIVHMEAGQCYELNVLRMHGSANKGKSIRVHLFLDYIPTNRWPMVEHYYKSKTEKRDHFSNP